MSGELMKAYRKENSLTQTQLAEELNEKFDRKYTVALISYAEKGLVNLPEDAESYLASKMPEKAFRNRSNEVLDTKWTTMPSVDYTPYKSAVFPAKEMTQTERIIEFIKDFGSITSWEAFTILGITRLASRIHDLTDDGYEFDRKTEKAKNRYGESVHFTRYSLRDSNGKEDMDRQPNMG